jgi:6-phosphofructokinase 2
MKSIVTLTINPAIDKSATVDHIEPEHKLRCSNPVFEAGGGGINVSRAIKKLGCESVAIFPVGGHTGVGLQNLLTKEGILQLPIKIKNLTRENFSIVETATNKQFRFNVGGSELSLDEGQAFLNLIRNLDPKPEFLVASGSLPPGLEKNFFAQIARIAKEMNCKFILDTSGEALKLAANEGVYLLKPNLSELHMLAHIQEDETIREEKIIELAMSIIDKGNCEVVVVSMGAEGALLISRECVEHISAPKIHKKSTVGAGDSMVAGMVLSLAQGKSLREMIRYGVACGTAATMNEGTELCKKSDVDSLYDWILAQHPLTA